MTPDPATPLPDGGPMNELVEAAARAIHTEICPFRSELCPHGGVTETDRLAAQAALTAAKVPSLLERNWLLREYVTLLEDEEGKSAAYLFVHGHRVPDEIVQRGQELRDAIARLEGE